MYNKVIEVSAGVILNSDYDVLAGARLSPEEHYGKYVYCGGKVEDGETLEQALVREVKEEVGLTVLDLDKLVTLGYADTDGAESKYKGIRFRVWFFLVNSWGGTLKNKDEANTKFWEWIPIEKLALYPITESMTGFFTSVYPSVKSLMVRPVTQPLPFYWGNMPMACSGTTLKNPFVLDYNAPTCSG